MTGPEADRNTGDPSSEAEPSPEAEHNPEAEPSPEAVSGLLREQCPPLADRTIRASRHSGSSNWVFRVGEEHAIRLPRSEEYVPDLLKETTSLPELGPELPVAVPEVLCRGERSARFSRPWSVVSWVPGERPAQLDQEQQLALAPGLGEFVRALHAVDTQGLEVGAEAWGYRAGEPVTDTIDGWAESAAGSLADLFDPQQIRRAWRLIRQVPPASMPAAWIHTDLSAENVLVEANGRLAGVIDFGGLGIGDRSVDLLYAWSLFDAPARELLRHTAGVDEATWLRARAWAFVGPGLLTIAHYRLSLPDRTARLVAMVEAVADEVGVPLR